MASENGGMKCERLCPGKDDKSAMKNMTQNAKVALRDVVFVFLVQATLASSFGVS